MNCVSSRLAVSRSCHILLSTLENLANAILESTTITGVAPTVTCLVSRHFTPPKSINIHPVTSFFTLCHVVSPKPSRGSQSWCATCRLLLIDCSPGGQSILHQGVPALHPSTREGSQVPVGGLEERCRRYIPTL